MAFLEVNNYHKKFGDNEVLKGKLFPGVTYGVSRSQQLS